VFSEVGAAQGGKMNDPLIIAGKKFKSRLMVGTGRHRSNEEMVASIEASGAEIITVAIRRLNLENPNEKNIFDYFDWNSYTVLPNTAGCKTADEAIFTAHLAREVTGSSWLKLEVIPDARRLLPDPVGTFEAAKRLVKEGFVVLPYIHADPVLARMLEDVGCATVMPLGSAIGSGQGILTLDEIKIIIEDAHVPVVVDAGLGVPSEAAQALEIGADAVLVNSAIAKATDPAAMGEAFKLGVEAGRKAFLAGRIERRAVGIASSPTQGVAVAGQRRG
jgi:thiazole synthase